MVYNTECDEWSGTSFMKYIMTPEGRIVNSGDDYSPSLSWELRSMKHGFGERSEPKTDVELVPMSHSEIGDLKDHLGNVRVVVSPAAQAGYANVLQQTHYYPFGMLERSGNPDLSGRMSEISTSSGTGNRYLYNGKELQDDFGLNWYDYGARFYDPSLGRWHSVDPLAEKAPSWSPYRYGFNNPIKFIDPTGMFEDYYETENKDIVFRNSTEKTLMENGQTLKNIGSEYVEFKGDKLTLNYQTKNSDGDLQAKSFSVPAVSGRPDENGLFDYSDSRQMNIGNGPLPEGKYTINPKEVRNLTLKDDLIGQGLAFTQLFGKKVGAFPGGDAAWGMARLGIDPNTVKVGNVVRGGFTIHGGTSPGSAGCIDLMRTETSFFSKLQQYSQSSSVLLRVDYSKITTPIASPFNSTGTGFYNEW